MTFDHDLLQLPFERLVRSRLVRLLLALVLIVVGAWAFLPHIAYRIASSAFVNAELVRVTAPIAGRLSGDLPRKGDIIDHSITVNLIEALSPDRRHLLDLEQQSAVAKDRANLAKKQIAEIEAIDRGLESRTESYRSGAIERLGQQIVEAEAEKTGCLAENEQRLDVGSRMEQLAKSGYTSQIRSAEASATQEANAARCQMAAARVQRLKIERDSAQTGFSLATARAMCRTRSSSVTGSFYAVKNSKPKCCNKTRGASNLPAEVTEERNRLDRIGHSDLSLPADHVVWSVSASPGSTVTEGQTILDLADCAHRFVVVDLPEREFEQIKASESASVRLIGSDEWRQGKVRQVLGSAARTDDRLLAAQVPHPTSSSISVEVELLQDQSEAERNSFCNIGRMAEVRFQRTGLGLADRIFRALAWLTGSDGRQATVS